MSNEEIIEDFIDEIRDMVLTKETLEIVNALKDILLERKQDKKRIEELEEKNRVLCEEYCPKVLKNIRKSRNLTLHDLWLKINKEISLTRLSDINVAREVITNDEIAILNKYLDLTSEEIESLEDMKVDIFLKEHDKKINNLMALVPKDLKAGESIETICPNCGSKLRIAKASINGHLWITCEKEGVLICQ